MSPNRRKVAQPDPPNIAEPVDLRTLPIMEAASMLRSLGERLLTVVLVGEPCPDLGTWLSPTDVDWLATDGVRVSAPRPYRSTLAAALDGQMSPGIWSGRIWQQMKAAWRRSGATGVPEPLWPVVAHQAWSDFGFRRRMANEMESALARRYLFSTGEIPVPQLANGSYWTLIALTRRALPPVPSRLHMRLRLPLTPLRGNPDARASRENASQSTALVHLQAVAEQQTLIPAGWAGFWDQYVVAECLRCWKIELVGDSPLQLALAALPFLQETGSAAPATGRALGGEESRQPVLARPDWRKERPAWLDSQY